MVNYYNLILCPFVWLRCLDFAGLLEKNYLANLPNVPQTSSTLNHILAETGKRQICQYN